MRNALACWICLLVGIAALCLIAMSGRARAGWPPDETADGGVNYADKTNWPNDPGYGGDWNLWSFVPSAWQTRVTAENKRLGTGAHADRAWARTTGDRRVLISVCDSGSNWSNADLVNKWHLNQGELPAPTGCPGADGVKYDVNGDGVFNVQDYTTAVAHDKPLFTTVCDPRVVASGDKNANGFLDPQDLIAVFSDGKDDDGNGYKDDISGWDFFRNDNDPYDDTGYGHGNGEASDSSDEGNNGAGDIGTCPDCSVQLLRVADSFVADANDFAMAALYATDSGSSVIQEALGSIDINVFAKEAAAYAYANNVVIIASASDLNSFQHNFPNSINHTLTMHAITHDTDSTDTSTTFLNFNNCTNYGAQVQISVPGGACASEATGKGSGIAGLIYSAALKADLPAPPGGHAGDPNGNRRLTAEEVYQIIVHGVDDIYDPADASDPTKFPTRVGWEQRFGYGRINARSNVDQVFAGKIPPEVEIRSPEWFETVYTDKTPMVKIDGRVNWRHQADGDTADFVLEWAPGVEPDDNAWKPITMGSMMASGMDGTLATWDVSSITVDNPTQGSPDYLVNRYMVTLRVRAMIHSIDPMRDGAVGEMRHAAFLYKDPDLLPGFPIHLGSSGESSPKMADLDGDGKRELIVPEASGALHAYHPDGSELAGWPVYTKVIPALDPASGKGHAAQPAFTTPAPGAMPLSADRRSAYLGSTPAIGDIDGDKKPEVVSADYDGNIYAWHADGTPVSGWPVEVDRSIIAERGTRAWYAGVDDGVFASPVLEDFDGDGVNEVVTADMCGEVTIWKGDGTKLPGWPVRVWDTTLPDDPKANEPRQLNRILSSPAVGDLDGDKVPDIVVGTNENYANHGRLYAISGKTGQYLPGFPIQIVSTYILPTVGSGLPGSPSLADGDGDGIPEIAMTSIGGAVSLWKHDGTAFGKSFPNNIQSYGAKAGATEPVNFGFAVTPAFGDVDDDGQLDLACPTVGLGAILSMASGGMRHDFELLASAWSVSDRTYKVGFPQRLDDYPTFNAPLIADVDGDGHSEVVLGSAGYYLHAWNSDGVEAKGFPKFTGGWIFSTPAIGDMDGDGKLEMAVGTRDGWLYAWHIGGTTRGRIDWDSYHHDARNTGNYATALDQGTPASPPQPGCGCALGRRGRGAAGVIGIALALLALVAWRRRRGMMEG